MKKDAAKTLEDAIKEFVCSQQKSEADVETGGATKNFEENDGKVTSTASENETEEILKKDVNVCLDFLLQILGICGNDESGNVAERDQREGQGVGGVVAVPLLADVVGRI